MFRGACLRQSASHVETTSAGDSSASADGGASALLEAADNGDAGSGRVEGKSIQIHLNLKSNITFQRIAYRRRWSQHHFAPFRSP